jgi:hypothetical protein
MRNKRVGAKEEISKLGNDFLDRAFPLELLWLDACDFGNLGRDFLSRVDQLAEFRYDTALVGDFDRTDFDYLRLQY